MEYEYCSDDYYTSDSDLEGEGLKDLFDEIGRRIKGFELSLKGYRKNIKPSSRKVLEKYGNMEIKDVKVCRRPISDKIGKLLKVFQNKEKVPFDTLFHLFLVLTLENGKQISVEKNADINIQEFKPKKIEECRSIKNQPNKTINLLLENTRAKIGDENFFEYDALNRNCQIYIRDLLVTNHYKLDADLQDFILQNVEGIVPKTVEKIAKVFTDFANRVGLVIEGKGFN